MTTCRPHQPNRIRWFVKQRNDQDKQGAAHRGPFALVATLLFLDLAMRISLDGYR